MNEDHPTKGFQSKPLWARAWVVAAGPAMNLVFAVLALTVLYTGPQSVVAPILGAPAPGSAAALAGLAEGDRLVSVAGTSVRGFQDIQWAITRHGIGGERQLLVQAERSGRTSEYQILLPPGAMSSQALTAQALGLQSAGRGVVLGQIGAGSAAEAAGLRQGDVILKADGEPLAGPDDFIAAIRARPNQSIELQGESGQIWRPVLGQGAEGQGFLGAGVSKHSPMVVVDRGLVEGFVAGLQRTGELSMLSFQALGAMVEGRLSWTELSGPATIATAAGESAQRGASSFLAFLALISVSIAVLNLLPVPMLDGGHLLYYAIEWIRGRPLSNEVQQIGQRIGLGFIVLLTGLALTSDALRLFGS